LRVTDAGAADPTPPIAGVDVVIATYQSGCHIDACLDSLAAAAPGVRLRVIVVDSASSDDTRERVKRRDDAELLALDENVGYARANNRGIDRTDAPFVYVLNPDTVSRPGSLAALIEFAVGTPACGVVGPRLLNADGTLQPSAGGLPTVLRTFAYASGATKLLPRDEARRQRLHEVLGPVMPRSTSRLSDHRVPHRCDVVSGAAMVVRGDVLRALGGFDEGTFMYEEETDLCARLAARGWQTWFAPQAEVVHLGGGSSPFTARLASAFFSSRLRFFRRNRGLATYAAGCGAVAAGLAARPAVTAIAERDFSAAGREAQLAVATARLLLHGKGGHAVG
jgi:N-acetylglucosaminyl-diphospho-decaprenol L-rhamnosyltransferase